MKYIFLKIIILFILISHCFAGDIGIIHNRLKKDLLDNRINDDCIVISKKQNEDGSWNDIDYVKDVRVWPSKHLSRIKQLSLASESNFFYRDEFRKCAVRGIEFWLNNYKINNYSNWWIQEIGIPKEIAPFALIFKDDIPSYLKQAIIKLYPNTLSRNGVNRLWISENLVIRGLLENDEEKIKNGLAAMEKSVFITDQEGHQADHSYLMHGNLLYNGGYGKVVLSIMTRWTLVVKGTKFSFSKATIDELSRLALEGNRWMMWGSMVDVMTLGREISRKGENSLSNNFLPIIKNLKQIDSLNSKDYDFWIDSVNEKNLKNIVGCRYFWKGEFLICRDTSFYVSLKMSSRKSVGSETLNQENKLGNWLGMGILSVYRHADDFKNIYPLWNWNRLPGLTSYNMKKQNEKRMTNESDFSGGVSDSSFAVASMIVSRSGMQAKKTWVVFKNKIFSMGSDILDQKKRIITTTVDQRILRTPVFFNKGIMKKDSLYKVNQFLHNDIVYTSLDNHLFNVKTDERKENWSRIGTGKTQENAQILEAWLEHQREDDSYIYLMNFDSLENKFEKNAYDDWYVLKKDTDGHVICNILENFCGGSFFNKGKFIYKNLTIEFLEPLIFILRKKNGMYQIILADPLQKASVIHIRIFDNKKRRMYQKTIDMPKGQMKGSMVKVLFSELIETVP